MAFNELNSVEHYIIHQLRGEFSPCVAFIFLFTTRPKRRSSAF